MPSPEMQRVAVEKKRIPEKREPRATLSLPSNQRYVTEEGTEEDLPGRIRGSDRGKVDVPFHPKKKTAEDVGSAGLGEDVVHPQGVFPEIMVQDESEGRNPEIVIQDSSDQVLFGNLVCAPPALCTTENEVDSLEGTVVSKGDFKLLERKVDQQKAEMDRLRAQNEMLIEMLKKFEQHQEKSSEAASGVAAENKAS
jgi:hypothetical protein